MLHDPWASSFSKERHHNARRPRADAGPPLSQKSTLMRSVFSSTAKQSPRRNLSTIAPEARKTAGWITHVSRPARSALALQR
ncbi:hypothetical protein ACCUM_0466 [Candidatus Accumulibacter phosphatis]|uniref:Uncharacterized protein n=1 Tax=Candidatus Accumulibacter phosphatis TaxID=327160 RepID=A0A5S4EKD7_9PROT|nr:hypothetical protein ACCUM_0466 [Candidatus Accumulibacter phosphatis]